MQQSLFETLFVCPSKARCITIWSLEYPLVTTTLFSCFGCRFSCSSYLGLLELLFLILIDDSCIPSESATFEGQNHKSHTKQKEKVELIKDDWGDIDDLVMLISDASWQLGVQVDYVVVLQDDVVPDGLCQRDRDRGAHHHFRPEFPRDG